MAIVLASGLAASVTTFGLSQAVTSENPVELTNGISTSTSEIKACANRDTGRLRILTKGKCKPRERLITWAQRGPAGPPGPPGPRGPRGPQGSFPGFDDDDDVAAPPGTGDSPFGSNTGQAVSGDGAECTVGTITLTAGNIGPGIPANGQTFPITSNHALFSLIGNKFGGDGKTTFALPDLRSAAPNGMTYFICDKGIYPSIR
jgi:hypothetical protein